MATLLLAHPLFLAQAPAEQEAASPYFPLGLLYLAAYVRDAGHDVEVFDGTFESGPDAFDPFLSEVAPDVVGISAVVTNRSAALDLAARSRDRGVPVLVGGPDATARPELYASDPAVDVVVHHEGEETIVRLLELLSAGPLASAVLDGEPGVAFDRGGRVVVNPPRPPIEDLDALPMPARDLIDMDRYLHTWQEINGYTSMTVATARGCPYGCSWCADAVHGNEFRQRSPRSVAEEVRQLASRYDIDRLRIVDDVDGFDRHWVEQWAAAAAEVGAEVPFEALHQLERTDLPLLDVRDTL